MWFPLILNSDSIYGLAIYLRLALCPLTEEKCHQNQLGSDESYVELKQMPCPMGKWCENKIRTEKYGQFEEMNG